MDKLIERYVQAVENQLNFEDAKGVAEELRAHIGDMLSDDPSEQEVKEILESLGDPIDMACQYRSKERYLISPRIFDTYLSVLQKILTIVVIITIFGTFFMMLFSGDTITSKDFGEMLGESISEAIRNAFSTTVMVTIGFVIYEATRATKEEKWTIDKLPKAKKIRPRRLYIPLSDSIFAIGVTVFFIVFYIAISLDRFSVPLIINGVNVLGDVVNLKYMASFIPIFVIFSIAFIVFYIIRWRKQYWTLTLASVYLALNILFTGIMSLLLLSKQLFLVDLNQYVMDVLPGNYSLQPYTIFITVAKIIMICSLVFDGGAPLYKVLTQKYYENKKRE